MANHRSPVIPAQAGIPNISHFLGPRFRGDDALARRPYFFHAHDCKVFGNSPVISGKVWKFGDNINTDLMLHGPLLFATAEEQKRAVFSANRPGWVDQIGKGDIIVGGLNYGMGSSRPAARSLRNLGIAALLAESINGLFFRNAVNFGLLALECPGIHEAFEEGQTAEVSLDDFTVRNRDAGTLLTAQRVPSMLLDLMTQGGLYPHLERQGLIEPRSADAK